MNDTNFKQSLREKAEKYEMDAPEGLWEGIERSVKGRIFVRRFAKIGAVAAVAAAAALLVGIGIGLMREKPDTEPLLAEVPPTENVGKQASEDADLLAVTEVGNAEETVASTKVGHKQNTYTEANKAGEGNQAVITESVETDDEQAQETGQGRDADVAGNTSDEQNREVAAASKTSTEQGKETVAASKAPGEQGKETAGKVRTPAEPERGQLTDNEYYRDAFREDDARRRHRTEGLSVRLLAANSSSVSLNMGRMMDAADYAAPNSALQPANGISSDTSSDGSLIYSADKIGDILIANLNEAVLIDQKHHQPLTFGVRVAYPLTDRLAIESGLNYSLLRSDFSYGGNKAYEEKRQALHYLGIPLSLNYTLIRYRRLDFIVSAGAMAEKCVHGKVTTDYMLDNNKTTDHNTVSVKGLQWSSGVSASLQYNFAKHFGLFIEPGLQYRFGNSENSSVRSSYTEEPLNFSLAAGMRIGL